jgi:hypothetical protein
MRCHADQDWLFVRHVPGVADREALMKFVALKLGNQESFVQINPSLVKLVVPQENDAANSIVVFDKDQRVLVVGAPEEIARKLEAALAGA